MGAPTEPGPRRGSSIEGRVRGLVAAHGLTVLEVLSVLVLLWGAWQRDLVQGLALSVDSLRDLACAAQMVRDHAMYFYGPNIHAVQYGHLGPLYYYFLALPLAFGFSATALSAWFFAWHAATAPLALALGRQVVGRRGAWVSVLLLGSIARRVSLVQTLEHESFVVPFVLLAALALLAHERTGRPRALLGAMLMVGAAAQFQSLAAFLILLVVVVRWRSRRAVGPLLALGGAAAYTAPFALGLLPLVEASARDIPFLQPVGGSIPLHQNLVPLVAVTVFAALLGRAALRRPTAPWLAALAALAAALPVYAWRVAPPTDGFALRYFTFVIHLRGGPPELTGGSPEEWWVFATPHLLLGLVAAMVSAASTRGGPAAVYGGLGAAPFFVLAPTMLVFAVHPSFFFLSSAYVWIAYAIGFGVARLLGPAAPRGARAAADRARQLLGAALCVIIAQAAVRHSSAGTLHPGTGIMEVERQLRDFARDHGLRPRALRGHVHGVDESGRPFCPWGSTCQMLLDLRALSGPPPRANAPERHLRWVQPPTAITPRFGLSGDGGELRFEGEVETYVPALRYDASALIGRAGQLRRTPTLPYNQRVCPSIGRWPEPGSFVDDGTCGALAGPLVATIERDETAGSRRGAREGVRVLALDASPPGATSASEAPCALRATQDGRPAPSHLVADRLTPGQLGWDRRWMIWHVELAPYAGRTRLRFEVGCRALVRLDAWDEPTR